MSRALTKLLQLTVCAQSMWLCVVSVSVISTVP